MNSHIIKIPRLKQKNKLFNDLVDVKVNMSTIVNIVISFINNTQQFPKLSGFEKKEMVINAVKFLIKKKTDTIKDDIVVDDGTKSTVLSTCSIDQAILVNSITSSGITNIYIDTATLLNITNLINHQLFMSSLKIYKYTRSSSFLSTIKNYNNATSVILDKFETYRTPSNAQSNIVEPCICLATLQNLIITLEANTFTDHGSSKYGNNETLVAGMYSSPVATTHNGTLYLDAAGNPNAVFIFLSNGTHTISASASIVLQNSAQSTTVFWVTVSAITMGASCSLFGTFISKASITAANPLTFEGRLFSTNGEITLGGITASVPLGVSQIDVSELSDTLIYTSNGNISATSYTSNTLFKYDIFTTVGVINGFGAYDGTYPSLFPFFNPSCRRSSSAYLLAIL
jgi:hypothetical protein